MERYSATYIQLWEFSMRLILLCSFADIIEKSFSLFSYLYFIRFEHRANVHSTFVISLYNIVYLLVCYTRAFACFNINLRNSWNCLINAWLRIMYIKVFLVGPDWCIHCTHYAAHIRHKHLNLYIYIYGRLIKWADVYKKYHIDSFFFEFIFGSIYITHAIGHEKQLQ